MTDNNYTVGAGRVYIAYSDDPAFGERYLGNSPGFSYKPSVSTITSYDSDKGVLRKVSSHIVQVDNEFSLTLDNISLENLLLFTMSSGQPVQRSSNPFSKELRLVPGNGYDLGARSVRDFSLFYGEALITDSNYTLDGDMGLLFVRPDADIYVGQEVTAYFIGDGISYRSTTENFKPYRGPLRYVENNIQGLNRVLYVPDLLLFPDSELDLKSSTWRSFGFKAEVTSVPTWLDRPMQDDYAMTGESQDFGDLSVDDPAYVDDYGVHTNGR